MDVDKKTVEQIARLARLKISEEELSALQNDLSGILSWVEQLDAVDTKSVDAMTKVVDLTLPERCDKVTEGNNAEAVTANAPLREEQFYVVPKVVE